jgi:hypothetical protein
MERPGRWIKILRHHEPLCVECWERAAGDNEQLVRARSGLTAEQGRRGAVTGERFWCEVITEREDGSMVARVDNMTTGPGVPRLNDVIVLPPDEEILDVQWPGQAGRA